HRREDIPRLAEHFMRRMARKLGKRLERIDAATLEVLSAHAWPGNIRDLQNTIERAAVLATGPTLIVDWDLGPAHIPAPRPVETPPVSSPSNASSEASAGCQTLESIERSHILSTLRQTRGVIEGPKGAARLLDMKPSTVRFRMKKLGITKVDYLT